MSHSQVVFNDLPVFFEGNSRILKQLPDSNKLLCKLKPTVFSIEVNGPVEAPGIDKLRTELNSILCLLLHENGIKTSTIETKSDLIYMEKHDVPPIEIVVKSALVGSPKHIYKNIRSTPTRFNNIIENKHEPYVRFDWRNPLPFEDQCMPEGLANYFINTKQATSTALQAFEILAKHLEKHSLELIDICFFMSSDGKVICAEVSTDNCRLNYLGTDSKLAKLLGEKSKDLSVLRAQAILDLLQGKIHA